MFKMWLKTEESKHCITELWIIINGTECHTKKDDTDNDTAL